MAARKKVPTAPVGENPPVRVPPKLATQGPESGPSGDVVVDASAPSPFAPPDETPSDPKVAKQVEKAQAKVENEKVDRAVKVRATERGYLGNKIREEGDVFIIQLAADQPAPSWVEAVTDDVPTTPTSHSSEVKEDDLLVAAGQPGYTLTKK